MSCAHCSQEIEQNPLVVPDAARGNLHFHNTGNCQTSAKRHAARNWPARSGRRVRPHEQSRPVS